MQFLVKTLISIFINFICLAAYGAELTVDNFQLIYGRGTHSFSNSDCSFGYFLNKNEYFISSVTSNEIAFYKSKNGVKNKNYPIAAIHDVEHYSDATFDYVKNGDQNEPWMGFMCFKNFDDEKFNKNSRNIVTQDDPVLSMNCFASMVDDVWAIRSSIKGIVLNSTLHSLNSDNYKGYILLYKSKVDANYRLQFCAFSKNYILFGKSSSKDGKSINFVENFLKTIEFDDLP